MKIQCKGKVLRSLIQSWTLIERTCENVKMKQNNVGKKVYRNPIDDKNYNNQLKNNVQMALTAVKQHNVSPDIKKDLEKLEKKLINDNASKEKDMISSLHLIVQSINTLSSWASFFIFFANINLLRQKHNNAQPFSWLPDEIWRKILSYLPSPSVRLIANRHVCRRLYYLFKEQLQLTRTVDYRKLLSNTRISLPNAWTSLSNRSLIKIDDSTLLIGADSEFLYSYVKNQQKQWEFHKMKLSLKTQSDSKNTQPISHFQSILASQSILVFNETRLLCWSGDYETLCIIERQNKKEQKWTVRFLDGIKAFEYIEGKKIEATFVPEYSTKRQVLKLNETTLVMLVNNSRVEVFNINEEGPYERQVVYKQQRPGSHVAVISTDAFVTVECYTFEEGIESRFETTLKLWTKDTAGIWSPQDMLKVNDYIDKIIFLNKETFVCNGYESFHIFEKNNDAWKKTASLAFFTGQQFTSFSLTVIDSQTFMAVDRYNKCAHICSRFDGEWKIVRTLSHNGEDAVIMDKNKLIRIKEMKADKLEIQEFFDYSTCYDKKEGTIVTQKNSCMMM